ncbi:uncharacterized protein LOC133313770 [Gastrolobium bilobum]|uniref:uncharacterized protein LOC133313770 n=1 Tax=Gastrolobium bilobum TaxID=150636 RepID=UPI002AB24016|nr:uncharacterized protein LOC133313770 [Gastrolobium bilobum]
MAWSSGYRNVMIESDSSSVITLLSMNGIAIRECHLISRIRIWIQKDWTVSFRHTFREDNTVADWLANFLLDDQEQPDKRVWWDPPPGVYFLLFADLASVCRPREVVCSS